MLSRTKAMLLLLVLVLGLTWPATTYAHGLRLHLALSLHAHVATLTAYTTPKAMCWARITYAAPAATRSLRPVRVQSTGRVQWRWSERAKSKTARAMVGCSLGRSVASAAIAFRPSAALQSRSKTPAGGKNGAISRTAAGTSTALPTATRTIAPTPSATSTTTMTPTATVTSTVTSTAAATATATGTATATSIATASPTASPAGNPIQAENVLPGTPNWEIPAALQSKDYDRSHLIEGYASLTSVNVGGSIAFHVNVQPVELYSISIYRMGWYQGIGARLMQQVSGVQGVAQPACPEDPATRLVECAWSPSYILNVPASWTSGVYLARLTRQDGFASYIMFVVRNDASSSTYLFQSSVTTFEAYNDWGGESLYGSNGANEFTTASRAYKVSFDRPYSYYRGPAWFLEQEYPMVRWLERNGYDVSYETNIDTQEQPAMLLRHRAFFSVGHDEYWSQQMRDNVEAALRAGVSLGFFSGNEMSWNIRFERSTLGTDRVITCYKSATLDPLAQMDPSDATVEWAQAPLNRPQNEVTGMGNGGIVPADQPAGYPLVVTNSSAWAYQGVNVSDGTSIPGMVGYEYDHVVNNGHTPPGLIILALSPLTNSYGKADVANTTVYTAPSGAIVFAAGTIQWDYGLDSWGAGHADPRIQQITANVLARMATAP